MRRNIIKINILKLIIVFLIFVVFIFGAIIIINRNQVRPNAEERAALEAFFGKNSMRPIFEEEITKTG